MPGRDEEGRVPARQGVWENTQVPRAWNQAGEVHTAQADHGGLTGQAEGLELDSADGDEPWKVLKPGKAGMENGGEVETKGSQTHEEAGHGWQRGHGLVTGQRKNALGTGVGKARRRRSNAQLSV